MILLSKRREVIVIAHKRVDVIGDGKPWKPASQDDLNRDRVGFTNPNLHQRLDVQPPQKPELFPREYSETIQGIYLLRTTTKHYHDEENNPDEIP